MVHHGRYFNCTEVSAACPVEATTYGYYPSLESNAFFAAWFGCCLIGQLVLGIRYRTWSFLIAMGIGTFGEMVGYIGRLIMHKNPWSQAGFETQICCLILSPSFLAAGVYLSLKHLTLYFGPEHSRLRPKLYTWLFILLDIFSILLQASGGGIASTHQSNLINIGNDVMIAGIAFQVVTMAICGTLGIEFFIRLRKAQKNGVGLSAKQQQELEKPVLSEDSQEQQKVIASANPKNTKIYACAAAVAFVTIFVRCVYRLPEMSGGWGSPLMRRQDEFIVLDGTMVAIAAACLTVVHPGIFFPPMAKRRA